MNRVIVVVGIKWISRFVEDKGSYETGDHVWNGAY